MAKYIFLTFTLMMLSILSHSQKIRGHYDAGKNTFIPKNSDYQVGEFLYGLAVIKYQGKYGFINQRGKIKRPIDQSLKPLRNYNGGISTTGGPKVGVLQVAPPMKKAPINSLCSGGHVGIYAVCNDDATYQLPYQYAYTAFLEQMVIGESEDLIAIRIYNPELKSLPCLRCGECYDTMALISNEGKEIIPPETYRDIRPFFSGRAQVLNMEGKFGYIDEAGREVIPCTYTKANDFKDGVAEVQLNNQKFKIDVDGNRLSE